MKEKSWPKSKFDYWLEAHISNERPLGQGLDRTSWILLAVAAVGGIYWRPLWVAIPLILLLEIIFRLSWIMVYLYAIAGLCMGKSKFYKPWHWNDDPNEEAVEEAENYGRGE